LLVVRCQFWKGRNLPLRDLLLSRMIHLHEFANKNYLQPPLIGASTAPSRFLEKLQCACPAQIKVGLGRSSSA
jgi:hypothetical protein